MRRRHPLSGAIYEVLADGLVQVELHDRVGVFRPDGTWLRGDLTHADPQLCGWLAGPKLPAGMAGNPKDLPTTATVGVTP